MANEPLRHPRQNQPLQRGSSGRILVPHERQPSLQSEQRAGCEQLLEQLSTLPLEAPRGPALLEASGTEVLTEVPPRSAGCGPSTLDPHIQGQLEKFAAAMVEAMQRDQHQRQRGQQQPPTGPAEAADIEPAARDWTYWHFFKYGYHVVSVGALAAGESRMRNQSHPLHPSGVGAVGR